MAEEVLSGETREPDETGNDHQKTRDYTGCYSRDAKLDKISTLYSQYPLWLIQQETKLASYGMVSKWSPKYTHLDSSFRRRLQSKDNTGALRLWLLRHKKNPYPSKPEKIMLAILSRMTMTQVSTWFANARRRLKKELPEHGEYTRADISGDVASAQFCHAVYIDQN